MISVLEDTSILEALEFQVPCEAKSHAYGQWGHNPEEAAAYFVIAPCGTSRLMCAAWVETWNLDRAFLLCTPGCGGQHQYEEVSRVPL